MQLRHLAVLLTTLFALAAVFWADPMAPAPRPEASPLDPSTYDTTPRRQVKARLETEGTSCIECHEIGSPMPENAQGKGEFHEAVVLEHGINVRCFNCHNPKNMSTLVDHGGGEIAFKDNQLLCRKCHGPHYRDWDYGAHGRTSGHWDASKGPRTRLACIACHNPHSPVFKPMQSAPPPKQLHPKAPPEDHHG